MGTERQQKLRKTAVFSSGFDPEDWRIYGSVFAGAQLASEHWG